MPQTTPASSFGPAWNAPFIGTPAGWQGATRSGGYPSHTYQPTTPTTATLYSPSGWPGTPSTTLGEPYGPRGPNGPGRPNGPGGPGVPNPPGGSPLSSGVPFQGGDGSPGGGSQRSSPTHTQMVGYASYEMPSHIKNAVRIQPFYSGRSLVEKTRTFWEAFERATEELSERLKLSAFREA
ncbi:hypothetical protein L915_21970 [Phytophthora nicotianae]|uniref:Uncharacterized protein n=1 Tax=Phytophthora nicotianae TaxID=4792 RepID=W2FIW1_PHYNI|nr:hypothetical protein L915_21970 [Phytophthora nicotianae]